jgi:hypothetical protein
MKMITLISTLTRPFPLKKEVDLKSLPSVVLKKATLFLIRAMQLLLFLELSSLHQMNYTRRLSLAFVARLQLMAGIFLLALKTLGAKSLNKKHLIKKHLSWVGLQKKNLNSRSLMMLQWLALQN